MKLSPFYYLLIITIMLSACQSSFYTINTNDINNKGSGVIYALPGTELSIEIEVTEIERQKGPFSELTHLYFNTKNAIIKDEKIYSITDINIKTIPIIDSSNIYCINSTKDCSAGLLNLTQDGFIAGINLNDFLANKQQTEQKTISDIYRKNQILDYSDLSVKSIREVQYDTIYKEIIKDSGLVRIPVIQKKDVFKSTEKQAKETADMLFLLRDDRNALLKGENDGDNFPDGNALKTMLEELNSLEKQYMSLFTGREIKSNKVYIYKLIPEKNISDSLIYLTGFSEKNGISSTRSNSGNDLFLKLHFNNQINTTKIFAALKLEENQQNKKGFSGIVYRIPADVNSQIFYKGKPIYSNDIKVSQWGTLNIIPSKVFTENISIEFFPQFGSLKRISDNKQN